MTSTLEDYLKRIYEIESRTGALVQTQGVAASMGVTPGTATTMTKHLADSGYLEYFPRRGSRLTARGEDVARTVLRRHRIVELFLVEVLGLDWTVVHEEAEALEHALSPRVTDRLDELLGHPSVDPHGDPIPRPGNRETEAAAARRNVPLAAVSVGGDYLVKRILDQSPGFLSFAAAAGLVPGARLYSVRVDKAGDMVGYRLYSGRRAKKEQVVGRAAAAKVLVTAGT